MELIGQIVGVFGIIANVIVFQSKDRKTLLICKLISDIIWVAHFAMIGAFSGAAICCVALVRELVFMQREKRKWANHIIWPIFFITCSVVSTFFTWKGPISILPTMASAMCVIGYWIARPRLSRIIAFPSGAAMIIYDIFSGSISGIINETVIIISVIIGMIRLDLKKKDKGNQEEIPNAETKDEKDEITEN